MKTAILVLGSINDEHGVLSPISQSRCDKALEVYQANPSSYLLCTGGFGENFNVTSLPHAVYTRRYLCTKGIAQDTFLEIAPSRFTVEDATLSKPILLTNGCSNLIVVTSDFHMDRVKLIFNHFLPEFDIEFVEADTPLPKTAVQRLVAHEVFAIEREKAALGIN
jgi:uncharacterized SAM-binding protein YcdF (DUF218 family)